ncbi:MAG: hypothetical protein HY080_06150 [Gammaproteobacteria bacterium]|nr:hypothetical protein [Gammaproteobacteria bacterium]
MSLVTEQNYKLSEAGRRLGINPNLISRWKLELAQASTGRGLTPDERTRLLRKIIIW